MFTSLSLIETDTHPCIGVKQPLYHECASLKQFMYFEISTYACAQSRSSDLLLVTHDANWRLMHDVQVLSHQIVLNVCKLVCIHAGMQVCRHAGTQVCRYAGMQVCRYASIAYEMHTRES